MTVIKMSRKKLTRVRVLIDVADGHLSVGNAAGWNAGSFPAPPGIGRT
jgi:hypothetical protein